MLKNELDNNKNELQDIKENNIKEIMHLKASLNDTILELNKNKNK